MLGSDPPPRILTLGHSNRRPEDLVLMLRNAGVGLVADVRRFPHSRRYPWFSLGPLAETLSDAGIGYAHFEDLGGRLPASEDVVPMDTVAGLDAPWQSYAVHMATDTYQRALDRLVASARQTEGATAVMCAENNATHCHRQLLSDALTLVAGLPVEHLSTPGPERCPHAVHPCAGLEGGRVTYRSRQISLF